MDLRYLFAAVCVCLLASCSLTKALKTGKHLSKASIKTPARFATSFPFEIKTGHLQIPVKVNGIDFLFYLDTGAPTAVSSRLARQLEIKPVKLGERVDTLVTIDDLNFGGMSYNDVGGILVNSNDLFKRSCTTIDGLVGANVMNKNIWQIDYVNKQIVVTNNMEDLRHIDSAIQIPFTTAPFTKTPILELTLDNGQTVQLVYDTGFNGYVTLNTDSADKFIHSFPAEHVTRSLSVGYSSILGDSVAKVIDTSYVIQATLKSGNNVLGNVPVTYGRYKNYSENKNGVIGNDFFKQSIVTLDWSTKTMYVYSTKPIEKIYKTWGMSYGMVDDKLIVGSIVPGMEPQRLGVSIGDEIIEVNGINIATLTARQRCDYVDGTFLLVSEERRTSMFTIKKRSGETIQATFSRH